MPEVTIASLERDDVDVVCSLAREIWRAHYPPIIGEAQTEYMLAQRYDPVTVRSELDRADICWVVLREDERIVAFASSIIEKVGELKLDKLYVHPSRQRAGYGGLLIADACARARSLGLPAVVLAVNKHNHSAMSAYRKHGFGIREAVVKDIGNGFVMDDFIMERRVTDEDQGMKGAMRS